MKKRPLAELRTDGLRKVRRDEKVRKIVSTNKLADSTLVLCCGVYTYLQDNARIWKFESCPLSVEEHFLLPGKPRCRACRT